MYKGILIVGLICLLVGCGGGGGSSSGSEAVEDNNLTEDVDPYLGTWERNCVPSDDFEAYGVPIPIDVGVFADEDLSIYTKETLTIDMANVILSTEFFSDESCAAGSSISEIFNHILGLENIGGEIQARDEWVSKNGYDFVRYSIPLLIVGVESFPVGLHNVDDRLYAVEPFNVYPLLAVEEDFVVNFNKYYISVQD